MVERSPPHVLHTRKKPIAQVWRFAITPNATQPKAGWINLHLLLWKHMIYHLTIAETEDKPFRPHEIWQAALARFQYKANAKVEIVRTDILRAESRGNEPPDLSNRGACMAPLADITPEGKLAWNDELIERITKLTKPPKTTKKKKK